MVSKVEGLDKLKRSIATLQRSTVSELRAALDKSADEMVSLARGLAPVDEGDLRAGIVKLDGEHELKVDVASTDYKSIWIEHGTEKMPERPFFYPAYRAVRIRARSRITRAVRSAAKKAFTG